MSFAVRRKSIDPTQAFLAGRESAIRSIRQQQVEEREAARQSFAEEQQTRRYELQLQNALELKEVELRQKNQEFDRKSTQDRHKEMWNSTITAYETGLSNEIAGLSKWKEPSNAYKIDSTSHGKIDSAIAERRNLIVSAKSMTPTSWEKYTDPTQYLIPAKTVITDADLLDSPEYAAEKARKSEHEQLENLDLRRRIAGANPAAKKQEKAEEVAAQVEKEDMQRRKKDFEDQRVVALNHYNATASAAKDYNALQERYTPEAIKRNMPWHEIANEAEGETFYDEAGKPIKRQSKVITGYDNARKDFSEKGTAYYGYLADPTYTGNPAVSTYVAEAMRSREYGGLRSYDDVTKFINDTNEDYKAASGAQKTTLGKVYQLVTGIPPR